MRTFSLVRTEPCDYDVIADGRCVGRMWKSSDYHIACGYKKWSVDMYGSGIYSDLAECWNDTNNYYEAREIAREMAEYVTRDAE